MTVRRSPVAFGRQLVGACSLWLAACGSTQGTHRVIAGQTVVGPYIEPQAYAAYAEGSYLEGRGDWDGAERAYLQALDRDPDSPGIWTRLGVIACRRDLESALERFQTDGPSKSYAPAWAERARCLRDHGNDLGALESARRAIQLDPDNADANLLIADIYGAGAQPERASAWLFAWLLRDQGAASQSKALLERGVVLKDRVLEGLAREELVRRRELAALHDSSDTGLTPADSSDPTQLRPLVAMATGQPAVGLARAELLLAADPNDGNALVAALFASALLGNAPKFAELLHHVHGLELPEPELAQQMAALLRWYVGDAAAEHWDLAYRRAKDPPR